MTWLLNLGPLAIVENLLSMLIYGRGVRFVVPAGSAAQTALGVLRRYGVRTYAYSFTHRSRDRVFRVRAAQAQWAAYLLARAGVPVLAGPPASTGRGHLPAAWGVPARPSGWAGMVLAAFGRWGKRGR